MTMQQVEQEDRVGYIVVRGDIRINQAARANGVDHNRETNCIRTYLLVLSEWMDVMVVCT